MEQPLDSKPCPVVERPASDSNCFELRNRELERLLTNRDVADLPVVVVSVAGGFRLGKSFLLGFFIRYLLQLEMSPNASKWMGKNDIPLKGFSWKYGSARETTGILLWGKVFKVKTRRHGLVAVVLMDTEGSFDNTSTLEGNVTIFSMSMLLASVQVYNLSKQITQNDLEHLKLFAEYASMAARAGCQDKEAFQKLLFLVRDWQYPEEKPFGLEGGQALLDPWLENDPRLPREVSELRENIRSSFEELKCFLMPKPGDKVETKRFNGSLSDISEDFKRHLEDLVPYLLSPETLVPKQLNGRIIKCKELVCMFQTYFTVFKEQKLPQPKSVFDATAFVHNKRVIDDIVKEYDTAMGKIIKKDLASQFDSEVQTEHLRLMEECLSQFEKAPKMGKNVTELREQLTKEVNGRYDILKRTREMLQEFHCGMERQRREDREEAQRILEEKVKQMNEEFKIKNEEAINDMARIHNLQMRELEKEAMARQSQESSIWDTILSTLGEIVAGVPRLLDNIRRLIQGPEGAICRGTRQHN